MNHVCKTYVEFLYPGLLFAESSVQEVRTRDESRIKVPVHAYGFRFFDVLSVVVRAKGRRVRLMSERMNVSPTYYYGGTLYTRAEVKRLFPGKINLIENMKSVGCSRVLQSRTGNWHPFGKTDVLIEVA